MYIDKDLKSNLLSLDKMKDRIEIKEEEMAFNHSSFHSNISFNRINSIKDTNIIYDSLHIVNKCPKKDMIRIHLISYLISFSSFLWGYSISVLNVCISENAKGSILNDIKLNEYEQQIATALTLIGAWIGSLIGSKPIEIYGKKNSLIITNGFYIFGAFLCILTNNKNILYIGRISIGLACGFVTIIIPCLLTEIAPISIRGQITSIHQLFLTIGILFSGLLGYAMITTTSSGWRYLNGFIIIPAVVQCTFFQYIPESPHWLIRNKKKLMAKRYIKYLRPSFDESEINNEMNRLYKIEYKNDNNVNDNEEIEIVNKSEPITWKRFFMFKKELCIGGILTFFQAMTGINTIIFYSAKIFEYAGVHNPIAATASVGTVNVIITLLSVYLVDKYGRKILLLVGTYIMAISLIILSVTLLKLDNYPIAQGYIAVSCVLCFIGGFAVGLGAVLWVVLGEIIPTSIRSQAMGFFMAISYTCNIFIATCTLSIIKFLGTGNNIQKNGIAKLYIICSVLSIITIIFITIYLPETKGKKLDSFNNNYKKDKKSPAVKSPKN